MSSFQLDRFGRKLSEITGVIYLSPANDDDALLNHTRTNRITDEAMARNYLFDSSYDGFFYRTDASVIEQWQLWDDDDDLYQSRPRPPPSPFGLHEGLYHDDTTNEIQRYLRHMDEEDSSCSCSSSTSSKSSCSTHSSISTKFSRKQTRSRSAKLKSSENIDQFNLPVSNLQTSSFEPVQTRSNTSKRNRPIIIEKVLPNPIAAIPILHPQLPVHVVDPPVSPPQPESQVDYQLQSDSTSIRYEINDRGEKITKDGNRIVFMDVVQLNTNLPPIESYPRQKSASRPRSHRHRTPKQIPILDMRTIEELFHEKTSKKHRRTKTSTDHFPNEPSKSNKHLTIPEQSEVLDRYLSDHHQHSSKSSHRTTSSDRAKQRSQGKRSITSSTHSSRSKTRHHQTYPSITTGQPINYVERPVPPSNPISSAATTQQNSPFRPILTDAKLTEYISNIYGATRSIHSTSPSTSTTTNRRTDPSSIDRTAVENPTYISAFRTMQNNFNRNILDEYRHAY